MKSRLKKRLMRITGMKLGYRMFCLYVIGGVLPIIVIGIYWISGTNRMLVHQAEDTELTELETVKRQIQEHLNTVRNISQYFYFDEKLEEIAAKEYQEYQELVDDYRAYTAFQVYSGYYSDLIRWISIYMDNDTLKGNARFVRVDDTIRGQDWYKAIREKGKGILWQYMALPAQRENGLGLTRMVRTRSGKEVGVLAVFVRDERLSETLSERDVDTRLILNGRDEIAAGGERGDVDPKAFLPENGEKGFFQGKVTWEGEEYLMTCVYIPLPESEDVIQVASMQSYREILESADRQSRGGVALFLVSILLSAGVIVLFSWSFSRRVNRFQRQMQKAAEGNFELDGQIGGNDEISRLYGYLTTMIWKIQSLIAEVYREQLHAEQLKTKQKDAEYKMLASQINPHFLYNTLETIRMKARKQKAPEIEELVKMLAKILRCNIQAGAEEVTIESEAELLECYLRIQQYRFGDRIQYGIRLEDGLGQKKILPLLMQPIVENSIVHGLETKEGQGRIEITVRRGEDGIGIVIEDDGRGMEEDTLAELRRRMAAYWSGGSHIGICNVSQRIRLKYGDAGSILLQSARGRGTRVVIRIPDTEVAETADKGGTDNAPGDDHRR